MKVFVEAGAKKVFAGAIDWPGLARSGKTEGEALAALVSYVPRYRKSLGKVAAKLEPLDDAAAFKVVERLEGGSGTDFGVPSAVADFDRDKVSAAQLKDLLAILRASWAAFDKAAEVARGKALATGPRGGGRTVAKMRDHVVEADGAYIRALGASGPKSSATWAEIQAAFVEAIEAKLRGELPDVGPRGGERWPARYAIRRSAWHALDHAWEIEDRVG